METRAVNVRQKKSENLVIEQVEAVVDVLSPWCARAGHEACIWQDVVWVQGMIGSTGEKGVGTASLGMIQVLVYSFCCSLVKSELMIDNGKWKSLSISLLVPLQTSLANHHHQLPIQNHLQRLPTAPGSSSTGWSLANIFDTRRSRTVLLLLPIRHFWSSTSCPLSNSFTALHSNLGRHPWRVSVSPLPREYILT